ncbi:MAG: J domain-containing protein [Anaerolinea sp.]|nr:J domain-containing protein [Anaerolinea sp.]
MPPVNPQIRRWIAERIARMDSVRQCVMNREGDPPIDIQVTTWSSTVINIYLFGERERSRTIKRIISENTRVGIGTLIVIDARLVPDDGARCVPDEMLTACHALFKDRIYTYRLEQDVPKIGQVHFKAFNKGEEREIWYGPDIDVRSLPSFRVSIAMPNSVRGDWLIANFGSGSFWRSADYTAGREAFRQQQRTGFTRRAAWTETSWTGSAYAEFDPEEVDAARRAMGAPVETRLDLCYRQLGVGRGASYAEVKAAFRRLARELHPDVSHLPKSEAEMRFKTLNEAYVYIKTANGWN